MPLPQEITIILELAEDKLKSAQLLYDGGQWRDSVSRAYYCTYHAASAVLLSSNLTFSSHAKTIGAFNREFVKAGIFPKEFGKYLAKLQTDREVGDYRAIAPITEALAWEDLTISREFYTTCRRFLEEKYN